MTHSIDTSDKFWIELEAIKTRTRQRLRRGEVKPVQEILAQEVKKSYKKCQHHNGSRKKRVDIGMDGTNKNRSVVSFGGY